MSAEFVYAQVSIFGMRVEEDSDNLLYAIGTQSTRVSIIKVKGLCVTMIVVL